MPILYLPKSKLRRTFLVLVLVVFLALPGFLAGRRLKPWLFPPDPLVTTPMLALEKVQGRSLYFNTLGRAWLMKVRPELLTADDREDESARTRAFTQAPQ